jgi:hypothetical protein
MVEAERGNLSPPPPPPPSHFLANLKDDVTVILLLGVLHGMKRALSPPIRGGEKATFNPTTVLHNDKEIM